MMASSSFSWPVERGRGKHEVQANVGDSSHLEKGLNASPGLEHGKPKTHAAPRKRRLQLPASLQWIPNNWTWSKVKPVIRCAVATWVATVLFLIPRIQIFMGGASFLILIVPYLSPPSDPFLAVLEREMIALLFVTLAWGWSCLGIRLADFARTNRDPTATLTSAITGQYIEAGPTVIIVVFIYLGSVIFLYIRARQGPGPYFIASLLGCICLDVSLTTAVFYPYPVYTVGQSIVLPLTCYSAIALLASIMIFPSTISAQFTSRLQDVLSPLVESLELHRTVLKLTPHAEGFKERVASIEKLTGQSEEGITSLAAATRLLSSDLIYSRFSPEDFHPFQELERRITARATGMESYFALINPVRENFPVTPAPSVPPTPLMSTTPTTVSRPTSPDRSHPTSESHDLVLDDMAGGAPQTSHTHHCALSSSHDPNLQPNLHRRSRSSHAPHFNLPHHLPHHLSHHLLHHKLLSASRSRKEIAVGVFESQRYLNLEATSFHDPDAETSTAQMTALLSDSCDDLLRSCKDGLVAVRDWLGRVRQERLNFWTSAKEKEARFEKKLTGLRYLRDELSSVLKLFRAERRHRITDPYRTILQSKFDTYTHAEAPGHRYLFHCYTYQYHLIQVSSIIIEMLDHAIHLEEERRIFRIWTPIKRIFRWTIWEIPESAQHYDDENPDVIQGLSPQLMEDLGMARRRDPDALPPKNVFQSLMNLLYHGLSSLGSGNSVFAIKAATLSVLLCLPFFLKSSASFAYDNRFVWAIFIGQFTLARFRGDTAFGLITRIGSTLAGGLVGMVIWYMGSGSGSGNPYALAAICGVCAPFFLYARVNLPGPITTVFFLTTNLVFGYSSLDVHIPLPGNPGSGFSVAWRRFVLVTVGVVAAFVVSFLPPSTTIGRYQRTTLATTSEELGTIYCAIVSFANSQKGEMIPEINCRLSAVRSKLQRLTALTSNVMYELSLRGRWPAERYQIILNLQLQLANGLSHLFSVIRNLESPWTRALLRRNRFLDSDFQGDILAVISMISSSLHTGYPLPQITPCPLLDRSMSIYQGLDVIQKEAGEDYGLPRTLNLETLQNEQYLVFCVGVSTSFSIMTRLDRLMVATKEVVGEQFHIHGVGLASGASRM